MRRGIAAGLFATFSGLAALASDLTVTSKLSGEVLGRKLETTQVQRFSATKVRSDDPGAKLTVLVDYDAQVVYTIHHDKKQITRTTFQNAADRLRVLQDDKTPGTENLSQALMGDVNDVRVEHLGKDTVAGRTCDKVRVTVGKLGWEGSLDPSLSCPVDYASVMQILRPAPGPIGIGMRRLYEELAKLKGFPIKSRMTGLMGVDLTSEATEISLAALPASTWVLPDYPVVDANKGMKDFAHTH